MAKVVKGMDYKESRPSTWLIVQIAYERAKNYVQSIEQCRREDKARNQELETRVQELERGRPGPVQGRESWAQVTGGQAKPSVAGRGTPAPVKRLDNMKMRRTTVKVRDDKDWEAVKALGREDLAK
ncbi:MAG: hypothetical protein Q9212_006966, partial [Teloschistes hypoglaucus]